ncbi:MAG: hypothetical protein HY207_09160 [Nitrospirae bacterium]|nr:hypothetical protein [Nitrospirota bacterium]
MGRWGEMRAVGYGAVVLVVMTACAFTNVGVPGMAKGASIVPENLTALQVVERYGVPDLTYNTEERTYWVYRRYKGFQVNIIYISFGSVRGKDVQFELQDGRVVAVDDYDAGHVGAFGVYGNASPGMVAE